MDPITLTLLLVAAGYCVAAPDRRTLAASRGTAGAARSAAAAGVRQVRSDWADGRPYREAVGRRVRSRFRRNPWGTAAVNAWDGIKFAVRAGRGTGRVAYRTGRAAAKAAATGYRADAQRAQEKRDAKRAARTEGTRCSWTVSPSSLALFDYQKACGRPATVGPLCAEHDAESRRTPCIACGHVMGSNPDCGECRDLRIARGELGPYGTVPSPGQDKSPAGPPTTGETPDMKDLMGGELTTTGDLRAETSDLRQLTEDVREALERLNKYLTGLGDRYAGAPFGTAKLSKAVTNLGEHAKAVDPVVADNILEQATELEDALTEAENLGEHADSVKAEGEIHAFQPA